MNKRRTRTLGDYVSLLFYYKWRAAFVFTAVLALTVVYLLYGGKTYESEAKLFVRVGRENAGRDPTLSRDESLAMTATREQEINSIVTHLKSRVILEKTFDDVYGKDVPYRPVERERALRALRSKIEITSPRATTVVNVVVKDSTPERAQETAQVIIDTYLDEHLRIHRTEGSLAFFTKQAETRKEELANEEDALRQTKDRAGIGSVNGRRVGLEQHVSSIESQLQSVNADLSALTAKMSSLRDEVAALPEHVLRQMMGGTPTDGIADKESQAFKLRVAFENAQSSMKPEHPKVIALKDQVERVQASLASQQTQREELIDAMLTDEVALHASLTAQREELKSQLESAKQELTELNSTEVRVIDHERRIAELEREYAVYEEKREQAQIDSQLKSERMSNLSIMQPATFVPDHIAPRPARTLIMGGVLGCMLAGFVVLLSDRLDPRVRRADDIANELGLRELASIPSLRGTRLQVSDSLRNGHGDIHHVTT